MDTGDKVRVEGEVATIVSRYASGKHTQFCLDDGRAFVDLHLRDDVEVLTDRVVKSKSLRTGRERPVYGEDLED